MQFGSAQLFGAAPLHDSFATQWSLMTAGRPFEPSDVWIAATMVALMTASQIFTQLQASSKEPSLESRASPLFRQQRILTYLLPVIFVVSRVALPLGVLFYLLTSNRLTLVQQVIVVRTLPPAGAGPPT
ncbi:YidC/Oxa1 family membrane protein insertase [Cryobacterium aureum]|uniref:YidC/Oxa1 family membrane protein insertase n=1 Tax=Cryobacterium aureum TaxID=995037 RepID=UPI000CF4DB79|nr:YidC/Oxa1 family membrane protein insertase [Cryobacterium aureum]